ncbi:MAG: hypothetical protein AAF191_01810, partial [Verrucomicrobiota bacterium]
EYRPTIGLQPDPIAIDHIAELMTTSTESLDLLTPYLESLAGDSRYAAITLAWNKKQFARLSPANEPKEEKGGKGSQPIAAPPRHQEVSL